MPCKIVFYSFHCHQIQFPIIFFFFNDTATTEIYTLSLHDALPILALISYRAWQQQFASDASIIGASIVVNRSEEHTSELQSLAYLVCRLLLEKKKNFYDGRRLRGALGSHQTRGLVPV